MIFRNRILGFLSLLVLCVLCTVAFANAFTVQITTVSGSGSSVSKVQESTEVSGINGFSLGLSSSGQLILLGAVIIILLILLSEFISKFVETKRDKSLLEQEIQLKNKKLNNAIEVLAIKNDELKKFNYILAHDLKEPVRIINAYSGLIAQKSKEDETLSKYASQIIKSSKQLNSLIQDAGSYIGIETENLEVTGVDTQSLIKEINYDLKDLITEENAVVITHDLPQVAVHKESLVYILSSLIKNGIVYNDSDNPQILVYYKSTANYHKFYVSDNGMGVESDYGEKIFEMFQRLHTKDVFPGTGLGLSACTKLAKAINGKISLHKSNEEGSTFVLKFRKVEMPAMNGLLAV